MLDQIPATIDLIAPIDIPGPPTDLAPPCHAWPPLAALSDPQTLTATTMPPAYNVPLSGVIIGLMIVVIVAVCLTKLNSPNKWRLQ